MGFSRKRTGTGGRVRYTAIYRDLRGRQRSAGSFATRREADRAWQRAEVMLGLGRVGDPARGRQTFERYVEDVLILGEPDRDQLYAALSGAEERLGRPVQATIRGADWLDTGSGAFHDTVTSRPLLRLPPSTAS